MGYKKNKKVFSIPKAEFTIRKIKYKLMLAK